MKNYVIVLLLITFTACENSDPSIGTVENIVFDQQILNGNIITAIEVGQNGEVWVGAWENKLIKIKDGETVTTDSLNSSFNERYIRKILVDKNNNLWVVGQKLWCLENGVWRNELSGKNVWAISKDNLGNIWASGGYSGNSFLARFSNKNWEFIDDTNDLFRNYLINDFNFGENGNAILALQGKYVSDSRIGTYNQTGLALGNSVGLYWWKMILNGKDNVVYGTVDYMLSSALIPRQAVYRITPENVAAIDPAEFTNRMYTVSNPVLDSQGKFWIAFNFSEDIEEKCILACYDGATWSKVNINNTAGRINVVAIEQTDKIWLGTDNGVIKLAKN
jgi:ligand-binding sensor domain-containing protein